LFPWQPLFQSFARDLHIRGRLIFDALVVVSSPRIRFRLIGSNEGKQRRGCRTGAGVGGCGEGGDRDGGGLRASKRFHATWVANVRTLLT